MEEDYPACAVERKYVIGSILRGNRILPRCSHSMYISSTNNLNHTESIPICFTLSDYRSLTNRTTPSILVAFSNVRTNSDPL